MHSRWLFRAVFWASFSLALGGATFCVHSAAQGENAPLHWVRTYSSTLPPERLTLALEAVATNWPLWHFHTVEARVVDGDLKPLPLNFQQIQSGSLVRLTQEIKGRTSKRYALFLQVVEYEPRQRLHLRLWRDTKGQIDALVDGLEWKIELEPEGTGSRLIAQIRGATRSARARVLARFTPGVLMNQLWLADVAALAQLQKPKGVIEAPQVQR